MLIRRIDLDRIASGEIDLAFRRWKRPTVRAGGTLTTAVGLLAIDAVDVVEPGSISSKDAARAGYASKSALTAQLTRRGEHPVYRVRLRLAGPDPRVALRNDADLEPADISAIDARLARLDTASPVGEWTAKTLQAIRARPATLAAELAGSVGMQRDRFKRNVRKLKALGLTESLERGYRLSPRGQTYLRRNRED